MAFELHHLTAQEQWDWLQRGEITPAELTEHYLERILRLDGGLGAFVRVLPDDARRRAAEVATSVPRTRPLWGLPMADKDLDARAGVPAGYGSAVMTGFVPTESDRIVIDVDQTGAVNLGRTNTPEFGLTSYTESAVAPPACNPWNTALGSGGSSGGAATAVSAGLLPVAVGSDGGGSVRIPAAACGLVGLKPSRGLVPARTGLDSLAGLVVPGPIARTVADAAMVLDALVAARPYPMATRSPEWTDGSLLGAAVRGEGRYQVGVTTSSPWDDAYEIEISPEARHALESATRELDALGHGIERFDLERDESYAPAFRTVWQVGAAGIPAEGADVARLEPLTAWLVARGREVSGRILAEALAALSAYERSIIRQLASFDAVMTPSLALTPRPVGWYDRDDPERNFAQQVVYTPFTSVANVCGLPAITLPVHQTADGLPMGVQLMGRPGGEQVLVSIGTQLERRLAWHRRHPAMW
ncbi:MAG: hypothetical protein RI885_910 [Actinomycetota bacterium]|jgi:amidase